MVELLKHDYKILFSHMKVAIALALVTPFLLNLSESQYLLNHSLLIIILICGATNRTAGTLLNSLPQENKEIVKSRYIFMTLNSLVITIFVLSVVLLLDPSEYSIFLTGFKSTLGFYYCVMMFTALILPLTFMFSKDGSVAAMMVAYVFLNSYMYLIYLNVVDYILVWTFIILIWIVSSYFASLSVFNEREFDKDVSEMKNLIKKEIQINRDLVVLALIFPFLSLPFMRYNLVSQHYYSIFPYYSVFMIGLSLIGSTRQHNINTEALFLSLPINRDDILKGRYMAYGILTFMFNALLYIAISIATIFLRFQYIELDLNIILFSSAITLLVLAILIPILYKVKKRNVIFSFGLVILSSTIRDVIEGVVVYRQGDIDYNMISIIFLIIAAISYVLSFYLNKGSIKRRWASYDKVN